MKLIIFGATGSVGKHLLTQALERGHEVTVLVRTPEKLKDIQHERIRILKGDVLNYNAVLDAVIGQDAVMCTLGAGRDGVVRSEGTLNIVNAMQEAGVKRLICQTTLGCGSSWQNLNFFWKRIMFGWFLKDAFHDHEVQETHVFESSTDWTIVRPGAFTNGKLTGDFLHGFSEDNRNTKLKISRADVAYFMLAQLNDEQYLFKTPAISY